jgi:class 3 adenylate cyclase
MRIFNPRRAESRAERRQLTVMFCDLVGSTALSGRLDPEDLRSIIGTYHRCCTELIERSGGFVAKYMGDGVLAYLTSAATFCSEGLLARTRVQSMSFFLC